MTWHVTATVDGVDEQALLQQVRAHLTYRVVLRLDCSEHFRFAARMPSSARCAPRHGLLASAMFPYAHEVAVVCHLRA